MVSMEHYHSDNGVFTSKSFTDSCKDKGRSQSFSGVGAQHQNAEAERCIQTVLYMDRSFVVHCVLHWGEYGSDNISLLSFSLNHAAWLYNKTPQRLSGLTSLEMVTSCKADHTDLSHTHVWGYQSYILSPVL